ncbi:hypothetical protein VTN77DRAFT_5768 [Rasamsonia byssochlamydoides]|uniref:uncharacterized protein n=1 Tax=Rasamsonia byssochlamydoides TaxID=89139 RepID=UPI0037429934
MGDQWLLRLASAREPAVGIPWRDVDRRRRDGTTLFEIGSVLLMLEAVNENQIGCFGWALETVLKNVEVKPGDKADCLHHHADPRSFVGQDEKKDSRPAAATSPAAGRSFEWLPSLAELRSHYIHELGFLASLTQLIGATVFWTCGFTGLPGILNHMSQGLTDGVYWVPQMVLLHHQWVSCSCSIN